MCPVSGEKFTLLLGKDPRNLISHFANCMLQVSIAFLNERHAEYGEVGGRALQGLIVDIIQIVCHHMSYCPLTFQARISALEIFRLPFNMITMNRFYSTTWYLGADENVNFAKLLLPLHPRRMPIIAWVLAVGLFFFKASGSYVIFFQFLLGVAFIQERARRGCYAQRF